MVPTPRMNSEVSLFEAPVRKFSVGTCWTMLATPLRLSRSSCSPSTTETATGTFCNDSSRRVAVTVTGFSVGSWSLLASAANTADDGRAARPASSQPRCGRRGVAARIDCASVG